MIIESLLDTDLYKFTMQQVVWSRFRDAQVEYRFQCRTPGTPLTELAAEIRTEIDSLAQLRLTPEEADYLAAIRYLKPGYLEWLRTVRLDPAQVEISCEPDFAMTIRGPWTTAILLETPVLAIISELYARRFVPPTEERLAEGHRRIDEKCRMVAERPEPPALIEFGSRRRYSRAWQHTVTSEIKRRIPHALVGTSNVALARSLGLRPFGTMAHEFFQACQAYAPLRQFQRYALEVWLAEYRGDLGIALTDVVGMDAFLRDFDRLLCKAYDGCRQDSGDPIAWGEKLIAHYLANGIDPSTKFAVFSDALDLPKAFAIADHFAGRIRTSFGIGTNFSNDLGVPALQIVVKMVRCNGQPVAKLSDSEGKAIGGAGYYIELLRNMFPSDSPQS